MTSNDTIILIKALGFCSVIAAAVLHAFAETDTPKQQPDLSPTSEILLGRIYDTPKIRIEGQITSRKDIQTILRAVHTRVPQPSRNKLFDSVELVFLDEESKVLGAYRLCVLATPEATLTPIRVSFRDGYYYFENMIVDKIREQTGHPRILANDIRDLVLERLGEK